MTPLPTCATDGGESREGAVCRSAALGATESSNCAPCGSRQQRSPHTFVHMMQASSTLIVARLSVREQKPAHVHHRQGLRCGRFAHAVADVNAVECQDGAASEEEPKTPVLRGHRQSSARAYRKGSYCVSDIVAPPRLMRTGSLPPEVKASGTGIHSSSSSLGVL